METVPSAQFPRSETLAAVKRKRMVLCKSALFLCCECFVRSRSKVNPQTFSKDKTLAKVFQKARLAPNAPSLFLVHFIRNHTYGDLLVLQLLTEIQKRLSIFSFWVSSKKLAKSYLLVPILLVCSEIIGKHLSQRFYQFLVNSILF